MLEHKLLIFDIDGVILDAYRLYRTIAKDVFKHEPDKQTLHNVITLGGAALFDNVVGEQATDLEIRQFRQAQIDLFDPQQHLFPNVCETINKLAQKNILAVLSNKPQNIIEEILIKSDIRNDFELIIGLDSGFNKKPSIDGIQYIIEKITKSPCFIGDSYVDFLTAKNANIPFIYCSYGFDTNPINHKWTLDNISELVSKNVF